MKMISGIALYSPYGPRNRRRKVGRCQETYRRMREREREVEDKHTHTQQQTCSVSQNKLLMFDNPSHSPTSCQHQKVNLPGRVTSKEPHPPSLPPLTASLHIPFSFFSIYSSSLPYHISLFFSPIPISSPVLSHASDHPSISPSLSSLPPSFFSFYFHLYSPLRPASSPSHSLPASRLSSLGMIEEVA